MNEDFLHKKLNDRKEQNSFRQLKLPDKSMTDLCSNDYLGIVKNGLLNVCHTSQVWHTYGSSGSRLLTGNNQLIEDTEKFIARFHHAETALIFNSGYDANLGLLASVPQRSDTVFYDSLSHASIRDGIRLSFAQSFSFQHNDLNDLESKMSKSSGNLFVVTESVFSMDGDICPLEELVALCEKYNAHLIIDEAHATGIIGSRGEGLVQKLGLESKCFARIHTFGKACGVHGAVVLGSNDLRDYLINFARSFVYSTALPEQSVAHIKASYELFPTMQNEREELQKLIGYFKQTTQNLIPSTLYTKPLLSTTPIQGIVIPGNEKIKQVADHLRNNKLDVRPILYPTVPKGQERLRIILHSFNTENEIETLAFYLKNSF